MEFDTEYSAELLAAQALATPEELIDLKFSLAEARIVVRTLEENKSEVSSNRPKVKQVIDQVIYPLKQAVFGVEGDVTIESKMTQTQAITASTVLGYGITSITNSEEKSLADGAIEEIQAALVEANNYAAYAMIEGKKQSQLDLN